MQKNDGTPYNQGDHNWVSGSYPNEFKFFCKWCEGYADTCPWTYWASVPADFEACCDECHKCDCANAKSWVSSQCRVGGICEGIKYDVWENGTVLCGGCFESR